MADLYKGARLAGIAAALVAATFFIAEGVRSADLYKSASDVYAYPNTQSGRTPAQPARIPLPVTPSDTQDLPNSSNTGVYAKSLYIGGTGDVAVIGVGDQSAGGAGTAVVFKAHPVGYMPVQVRRVLSTGTTATNIVALMD